MTREQAIEIVKTQYPHDHVMKTALGLLIPELRESEDERIRKGLLKVVSDIAGGWPFEEHRITKKEALAYLEKQKELPFVKDVVLGYPGLYYYDGERMHFRGSPAIEEKQKEQKPAEWVLPEDFEEAVYKVANFISPFDNQEEFRKTSHRFAEQLLSLAKKELDKPVEWSEKDKEMLGKVLECIRFAEDRYQLEQEGTNGVAVKSWLLAHIIPQSKQKWSEEDDECIKDIIDCLEYLKREDTERQYNGDRNVNPKRYTDMIAKLKSLRPQPHKEIYQAAKHDIAIKFMNYLDENRPDGKMDLSNGECEDIDKVFKENNWNKIMRYANKYSWKPSEEQMNALKKGYESYDFCDGERNALESLYEQLQKLM